MLAVLARHEDGSCARGVPRGTKRRGGGGGFPTGSGALCSGVLRSEGGGCVLGESGFDGRLSAGSVGGGSPVLACSRGSAPPGETVAG